MNSAWFDSPVAVRHQAEVRFARDRGELEEAFRLVYRLYRQRQYSQPHPAQLRYMWHLGMPGSRTIVAENTESQIIGTISYVPDGPTSLPMDSTFGPELGVLRATGKKVAEVMSLAIDAPAEAAVWKMFYRLTRFLVQYALWQKTDELVIAIHPRHEMFYERYLGFVRFGHCRSYRSAEGNPATACRLDLKQSATNQNVRPSVLRTYLDESIPERLFQHADMSPSDHEYFCRKMRWDSASVPDGVVDKRLRRPA